jgi:hypothetical protein
MNASGSKPKNDQPSKNIERLRIEGFLGDDVADLF